MKYFICFETRRHTIYLTEQNDLSNNFHHARIYDSKYYPVDATINFFRDLYSNIFDFYSVELLTKESVK